AIEIRLENRGGGIGPLFATLNGSDISAMLLDQCPDLAQESPCTADLSPLPTWKTGEPNEVFAVVGNADNSLAARGLLRAVQAAGPTRLAEPVDLWVLAIGTSDYASPELDLRFAAEDAVSFGEALRIAGTNGFGAEHTNVRVLTSPARDDSDGVPTRSAVDEAFAWLEQADPYDTVVVFFAGHGKAFSDDDEVDDYFYMLPDARDIGDLRDPSLRALRSYSGADLATALSNVGALKRVVILDTCESGKAIGALGEVRELSTDAIRAHVRARDRTGAWFLAGAAADKPSYEATRFGQGILTYTLLEAMVGPALEADQIMVSRVFDHVGRQVPVYAEGVGGVQEPFLRPGNDTFPLGALPVDVRRRIELATSRPGFVRTSVLAEGGAPDREGVSTAVDRALRRLADGFRAPIVVFDAAAFPGGWQVTGQYKSTEAGLVLNAFLSQDVDAEPIVVEVRGADPEAIGTALTSELKTRLEAGGGTLSAAQE
ncbi:MAG: caspase family protein, partial [Myxococcota bacterium]